MTALNISSIIASFVSVVIGILAIWLSIMFYRWSNEASKQVSDSAKEINAGVERLEKLFDSLYSDTFNMMKETVSDMRQHAWGDKTLTSNLDQQVQQATREAVEKITAEVSGKIISEVISSKSSSETADVTKHVHELVEEAVTESVNIPSSVRRVTMRKGILSVLSRAPKQRLTAGDLLERLDSADSLEMYFDVLRLMRAKGEISWESAPEKDRPRVSSIVYLTRFYVSVENQQSRESHSTE